MLYTEALADNRYSLWLSAEVTMIPQTYVEL